MFCQLNLIFMVKVRTPCPMQDNMIKFWVNSQIKFKEKWIKISSHRNLSRPYGISR